MMRYLFIYLPTNPSSPKSLHPPATWCRKSLRQKFGIFCTCYRRRRVIFRIILPFLDTADKTVTNLSRLGRSFISHRTIPSSKAPACQRRSTHATHRNLVEVSDDATSPNPQTWAKGKGQRAKSKSGKNKKQHLRVHTYQLTNQHASQTFDYCRSTCPSENIQLPSYRARIRPIRFRSQSRPGTQRGNSELSGRRGLGRRCCGYSYSGLGISAV
jgi:hypothetical protein